MNARNFTLEELTRLVGNLRLFDMKYSCEVCKKNKSADVCVTSMAGIPIFLCISCATYLINVDNRNRMQRELQHSAKVMSIVKKRGRPKKDGNAMTKYNRRK